MPSRPATQLDPSWMLLWLAGTGLYGSHPLQFQLPDSAYPGTPDSNYTFRYAKAERLLRMQACENQLGYKPPTSRRCSVQRCTSDLDCSYHGTCSPATGQCSCNDGFLGPSCSVQTSNCMPGSPSVSPVQAPSPAAISTQVRLHPTCIPKHPALKKSTSLNGSEALFWVLSRLGA